jgi:hypothetical protein
MNEAASSTAFDFFYTAQHILIGLLFAIMLACVWPAFLHAEASDTAIIFYAEPRVHEEMWPALFEALHENLAAGTGEKIGGVALDRNPTFLRSRDIYPGIEYTSIIQVKLLGRCDVVPQADHPSANGPLGWAELVSGEVRPLVFIDCTRIAKVLGPVTLGLDKQARQQAMSQAIAHVLVHEWIHFATQSTSHEGYGIMQAHLSAAELITAPNLSQRAESKHPVASPEPEKISQP